MLAVPSWDLLRWDEMYENCGLAKAGTINDLLFYFFFFFKISFVSVWATSVPPAACKPCPAGTEPTLGYEYKWWNVLPANMKTSCFNVGNTKCDSMNGECFFLFFFMSLLLPFIAFLWLFAFNILRRYLLQKSSLLICKYLSYTEINSLRFLLFWIDFFAFFFALFY